VVKKVEVEVEVEVKVEVEVERAILYECIYRQMRQKKQENR